LANIVGDIAIQVGADIGPLVRDMGKAKGAVSGFGSSVGTSAVGMRAFAVAGAAMAAAVVAAGTALAALTKNSLDNIDATAKMARSVDVSVAKLQAMNLVAQEAGVEAAAFGKILVKMQDNISGLGDGTVAQVEAFNRLGLSFSSLSGLGADQQFALIAAALDGIVDPAQKTALALDVFGKSGSAAINMLSGYSGALRSAEEHQRKFGIAVSDVDALRIEAANDAMGRLSSASEGLGNVMAIKLAPTLERVALALTDLISGGDAAREALEELAAVTDKVASGVGVTSTYLNILAADLERVGQAAAADTLRGFVAELNAAKAAFDSGAMSADDFRAKIAETIGQASSLVTSLQGVDGVSFDGVISRIRSLRDRLSEALIKSDDLNSSMSQGGVDPSTLETTIGDGSSLGAPWTTDSNAPRTRPERQGVDSFGDFINTDGSGTGGGGGGSLQSELDRMREDFATEQELVAMQYEERLAKLREFRDAKQLTEEEYNELEASAKQEHEDRLAEIERSAQAVKMQAVAGAFGDLASLMQSSNDKLFKIGQAAAIAEAVVNGYSAAVAAWEKGMKVGGPPMAAAFTAASLAKTGSLIAGIASQSSSGSSGGGGSAASAGTSAGATSQASTYVNVQMVGGDNYGSDQVRNLISAINLEVENGAVIKGIRAV